MIYIVVEKCLGFGGGGWDTGYYVYIIHKGKVYKKIRTVDDELILDAIKSVLKMCNTKSKIRRVDYPAKDEDYCKQLIKVLCKETKKEIEDD